MKIINNIPIWGDPVDEGASEQKAWSEWDNMKFIGIVNIYECGGFFTWLFHECRDSRGKREYGTKGVSILWW